MKKNLSGAEIRQSFIDYFLQKAHKFVPSSSLVPGGDQTLLFTNAGMVQFKDVFLGTDHRSYTRAVNSQKCMRVAGKHNDLDDVGRDDTHHTFFEMLGNWSFGDYYKKEAISWAWDLLTNVWGLPKDRLWATCFKDEQGKVAADEEAAGYWQQQPGIDPSHVLYCGRKENFWEMAETGPCGPCSEVHYDRGEACCDKQGEKDHVCRVNGNCKRYLEIWNLVFIQYNRLSADDLEPLPACHVDTGMGLERVVSILQDVPSNYKTDLLFPLMKTVQVLTGQSDAEREANLTPYRVIADHARTATFLIADGVVPGNIGRNYVCRMIIRRAARFGSKIGLDKPFLAKVAETVIENYGEFYPELKKNRSTILNDITFEEERFQKTVESGIGVLEDLLSEVRRKGSTILGGAEAFDLYATHGVPLEIARDIAREQGLDVDDVAFRQAMEEHKIKSGAGKAFGPLGGEEVETYRTIIQTLQKEGKIDEQGVQYDPYGHFHLDTEILAFVKDGVSVTSALPGDEIEVILPKTCFYVESGGQVADTGTIISKKTPSWVIEVTDVHKPAAGVITHSGKVIQGIPMIGDTVIASVDSQRRMDIMRNHTATHLLHALLHQVVGEHARQAGSLVAPDRLRFDFTHHDGLTQEQLEKIEAGVNRAILGSYDLHTVTKSLSQAMTEGAMALFGEKYGDEVRTISIGEPNRFSYELCGGTHVDNTSNIGLFLILSEGSAAAGVRRIEAVTGKGAYEVVQHRFRLLKDTSKTLNCAVEEVTQKSQTIVDTLEESRRDASSLRVQLVWENLKNQFNLVQWVGQSAILSVMLPRADSEVLRIMADRFREKFPSSVVVFATIVEERPSLIVAVTDDLVKRGIHAGNLAKEIAQGISGSGGGRPNLAQAGGKDSTKLPSVLEGVYAKVMQKLEG